MDKETYYDFRNNYTTTEDGKSVEMIKSLTEQYDPIEVINPLMDNVEQ